MKKLSATAASRIGIDRRRRRADGAGERRRRRNRSVRSGRRLAAELLRGRATSSDRPRASGRRARIACYIFNRGCLPVLKREGGGGGGGGESLVPERNASGFDLSQKDPTRHPRWDHVFNVVDRNGKMIESWEQHNKLFVRPHRILVRPVRSRASHLARGRWRPCDLQVHARRQEAGADDRHADAVGQRPDALRPADRHRVAARRHVLRERRLRQHARRQVRQERKVPADVGTSRERSRTKRARAT